MITGVYTPRFLPVRLDDGSRVPAWAFIVDRGHRQYWRGSAAEAAALIRQGNGGRGSSRDYLAATVGHLDELGMPDHGLHRLLQLVDGG
jgi:cation transport protein ChaC